MAKFINIDGVRIHTDLINTYRAGYDSEAKESTIVLELEEGQEIFEPAYINIAFKNCGERDEALALMDDTLKTKVIRA